MVEELYSELYQSGIFLKSSADCRNIEYDAPRPLTDDQLKRLKECKPEMLDYLLEVEETAAILEIDNGCDPKMSLIYARKMVSHRRMCSRDDALQASVRSHPDIQVAESIFFKHFNYGLEIVSVEPIDEKLRAA